LAQTTRIISKGKLLLNVSITDDYGNPEGLELEWVWWGNSVAAEGQVL
jgi:hypothetical protein